MADKNNGGLPGLPGFTGGVPANLGDMLISGLAKSKQVMAGGVGGGDEILRILRDGRWVYGASSTEIEDNSLWLMNTMSLMHGYVCWKDAAQNGGKAAKREVMCSAFQDAPPQPEAWDGKAYSRQHSFQLRCMNGADEGLQVIHYASSIGSIRPVDALKDALIAQAQVNPAFCFPVIEFANDHYEHAQYNRVYTPVYVIKGWCDQEGNSMPAQALAGGGGGRTRTPAQAPAAAPAAAPAEPARRSRTRAAPAEPVQAPPAPPVVEAPATTQRVHTGQRRRPAGR